MIIEEYDESLFISRFEDYKRVETSENPNGNFSYKALRFLFEYIDDSYDEENPYKLDVISLCCEYSEYKNISEWLNDYQPQIEKEEEETEEEYQDRLKEEVEKILNDNTSLIKFDEDLNKGFIIAQY